MAETLAALGRELERVVRAKVRSAKGSFYCLVLNYGDDPAAGQVVPHVALGKVRGKAPKVPIRVRAASEDETLWNPAEFSTSFAPTSPRITSLSAKVVAAARAGAKVDLRAWCNGMAKAWNDAGWRPARATDTFFTYAVDDDLAHLNANLTKARPGRRA